MNGYFSSIVRRSQPAVAGLRANLFTAPAQDPGAEEGPVAAERVVAEHPGKSAAGANESADRPDIVVRQEENKTDRRQPGAAERLAEKGLMPGPPSGEGNERAEIERPGEQRAPEWGQRVDRVVERHSTIEWVPERQSERQQPAEQRSESVAIPVVASTSTPASTVTPAPATGQAQRPSNPATPKEAQRIVTANAALEKPLAPAAQPRPALVIGKITVEVQAPPSPAVNAAARAAAAAKNRRPRAAAPARRQLPHDPSKLGFGLGQL